MADIQQKYLNNEGLGTLVNLIKDNFLSKDDISKIVVQETGESENLVMSQKAVTDALSNITDIPNTDISNLATKEEVNAKEDSFSVGNGLEMTSDRVLNVTLDTNIFKIVTILPDEPDENDKNKIFLVPGEITDEENIFVEYVYTENGWNKFGEVHADIDLSEHPTFDDVATENKNGVMSTDDKKKLISLPLVWKGSMEDFNSLENKDKDVLYLIFED